jgi:hypothetical protein
MRLLLPALASCVLLVAAGCGLELTKEEGQRRSASSGVGGVVSGDLLDSPAAPAQGDSQPPDESQAPAEESQAAAQPAEQAADTGKAPANTTAAEAEVTVGTPSNDPNVETVAAKRGVGAQGRYEGSGMVITPIKAYFLTKQRTELEIKIPQALTLYKAEHGHFPKTLDDFMRDIIQFNQIKLPELPAGHRYVYKAETGELMVERPAK